MAASISITNITDGMVLGKNFTAFGDFAVAVRPETGSSTTMFVLDGPARSRSNSRFTSLVRCSLQTTTGATITTVNGVLDASNARWHADFADQVPGVRLRLVPELTVGSSSPLSGTPIKNLEIRDPLGITIAPPPPVTVPPGPHLPPPGDPMTLAPGGDFDLNPANVREFRSLVVIHGVVVGDSVLTTTELRVFNARRKWNTKKVHRYTKAKARSASHVIQVRMANGEVLTTSQRKLP